MACIDVVIGILAFLLLSSGTGPGQGAGPSRPNSLGHALAIFSALDAQRDGRLDADELRRIGGVRYEDLAREDVDRDGALDRGEFLVLHRRLLRRAAQTPDLDLETEVARILAQRRTRGLLAGARRAELEAGSVAARGGATPPGRPGATPHASSFDDLERTRAFHALERQVLAGADPRDGLARLRAVLARGMDAAESVGRAREAGETTRAPESILLALESDLQRGGRLAVVLLCELRVRLGVGAVRREVAASRGMSTGSRAAAPPYSPAADAGLRRGRVRGAFDELEGALAGRADHERAFARLRAWVRLSGSASQGGEVPANALDALESAALRGEPTQSLLDALRLRLGLD